MSPEEISAQYLEALKAHLAEPDRELGLNRAYEIGRNAVASGMSLLDMVIGHHRAVHLAIDERVADNFDARIVAAANFFAESVSPFEMILRGFREKNQQLQQRTAELEASNQALESANQELESFSFSVSHDTEAQRLIQVVRDGVEKMTRLIDDILAFSRTARHEMAASDIDMTGLVQAMLSDLAPAMTGRSIDVQVESLPPTRGDREMIRRVWMNLLDNAIKYTARKENVLIEVGAYPEDKNTVYFVKDNGAGFDMQYAGKLFGVFQRLHGPDEFSGTGIGLAIVKRIMARHGGRVWAEAKLGDGAVFYFALPTRDPT